MFESQTQRPNTDHHNSPDQGSNMTVDCGLNLLARSLTSNLSDSAEILGDIGETRTYGSFELEMSNWVTAFFVYSESQRIHIERYGTTSHHNPNNLSCAVVKSVCSDLDSSLIQRLIEQGSQSVMDSAQKTFTILQNKGNTGILIPRVRNHLFLSIVNLQVSFADHHDLVTSLASRFVQGSGLYHDEETCLIDLVAGEADGGEWVINWLKQNVAKTDQQVLDKIQTPR